MSLRLVNHCLSPFFPFLRNLPVTLSSWGNLRSGMAERAIEAGKKAYCSFLSNSSSCTSSIDHLPRVAEKEEGGSGCQLGLSVSPLSLPMPTPKAVCLR